MTYIASHWWLWLLLSGLCLYIIARSMPRLWREMGVQISNDALRGLSQKEADKIRDHRLGPHFKAEIGLIPAAALFGTVFFATLSITSFALLVFGY